MTKPSPEWQLLEAAKSALIRLDDLRVQTEGAHRFLSSDLEALFIECNDTAEFLREAITAYKEARNAEAS